MVKETAYCKIFFQPLLYALVLTEDRFLSSPDFSVQEIFYLLEELLGKINEQNIRKMTPREWARLQGFPDSFVLPVSDTQLYKQLGNTVSVPVIRAIAERIRDYLNKKEER